MLLLNPGPVNVTAGVRRALAGPDICHREEEFYSLLRAVRSKLTAVFDASHTHEAVVLAGSGTLAVEAMMASYAAAGGRILVLSNGVYGERLIEMLAVRKRPHTVLRSPLGTFPGLEDIESALRRDRSIRAVALVHHETSTGQLNPLPAVARLARRLGRHVLVDAVSSLGAEPVDLGLVDLTAGSAGKCLHAYPGAAFVLVRRDLVPLLRSKRPDSIYLDLGAVLEAERSGHPPFTPAVQLLYALDRALDELRTSGGVRARARRYAAKSRLLRSGLRRLGVRLLLEDRDASHVLQSAWLPGGVSYTALHDELKRLGYVIYAGQSSLSGRIFRLSNLGEIGLPDLRRLLGHIGRIVKRARAALPTAVVLAAGVGKRLASRTGVRPKCLIPIDRRGTTLLERYFDSFRAVGLRRVVVVAGHLEGQLRRAVRRYGRGLSVRIVTNREYRLGSIVSLRCASRHFGGDVLVMDADVFFPTEALERLLEHRGSAFLLDERSRSAGEEMMVMARSGRPVRIAKRLRPGLEVLGEATGIVKLTAADARRLRGILDRLYRRGVTSVEYEDAYTELLGSSRLGCVPVGDLFWTEMDFEEDLARISAHLTASQTASSRHARR
ncbi:MAG: 2-aminoethylphosphonate--pyruvate transaminase [Candidatus Omnitrophica bacterium]|nr:2-aminoethylphosphonate--pyruvate transaminase [Candidatus Omnitrophota bacterium]